MGTLLPLPRVIVVVDVENSTSRTNPAKARIRLAMYELLEQAFEVGGIAERHHDAFVDRGDGALILIHPVDQVPKTLLLNAFIPALNELLAEYNAQRPGDSFRLRSALHAGEIHYDQRGPFGEAIDIACRLIDAPELKIKLSETAAPLVLVASDDIYHSVIRHGYDGIDDRDFEPLVQLEVAGHPQQGWVCVPRLGRRHRTDEWLPAVG